MTMTKCQYCQGTLVVESDNLDQWLHCLMCGRNNGYLNEREQHEVSIPQQKQLLYRTKVNDGIEWTEAMDATIMALRMAGANWDAVGKALGLSREPVRKRAIALGMPELFERRYRIEQAGS